MIARALLAVVALATIASPGTAGTPPASSMDGSGIVAVDAPVGDDAAAILQRLAAIEERLAHAMSLTSGPAILQADTVDRLAVRLLALESRLATVEEATGVRESRGHGHDGAFQVALVVALLDEVQWTPPRETAASERDLGSWLDRQRQIQQLVRAAQWPKGLEAKVSQLLEAWKAHGRAIADGGSADGAALSRIRRELGTAASNWIASVGSGSHDHSAGAATHVDHSPHHGGQVGMKGDVHLEVVRDGEATWSVWLSDAWRQPMSVDGWSGRLVLSPEAPVEVSAALEAIGTERLTAKAVPPSAGPVDVRVALDGPGEPFEMDFQFGSGVDPAAMVHPPDCPMAPGAKDAEEPTRQRRRRPVGNR